MLLGYSLAPALCLCGTAAAERPGPPAEAGTLVVDASRPNLVTETGYLQAGGTNPSGGSLGVNSRYFTRDGRPWIPVMGEFQSSRYPSSQWEEELLKMKAGGVTVVATYVIWIHHEEEEGRFNWSGDCDLRRFVDLCARHGLTCFVRLGPWVHGEVRNGGFPDWLLARCGRNVRRDAEPYLTYVRRYYAQIAAQLQGRLWKDGGPVIGVQLDNELKNDPGHILTLRRIAREVGIDVPFYSMTGWDGARRPTGGLVLPMFAGYPDGFWIGGVRDWDRDGRKQYFFGVDPDDHLVAEDLKSMRSAADAADLAHYPYATCEIGGGIEVSYRRRPVIGADDVAAEALVKLGSGSNLQGYYVYHGGANPLGRLSTLNESRQTGYPNDMPEISYDFQAPLGEYGQRRPTYAALRAEHLFLADFGPDLAPLAPVMPERRPASLGDHATLRWSVRTDGRKGFLFVNNYQHLDPLPVHPDVRFQVRLAAETLTLPSRPVRIPSGAYFIWPLNLDLGGARLEYATAQPLCRVGDCWVFSASAGIPPEFSFAPDTLAPGTRAWVGELNPGPGCVFLVRPKNGPPVRVLVLTRGEALEAWKANIWGADRLFLSEDGLVFRGDTLQIRSRRWNMSFAVYPVPALSLHSRPEGIFARFQAPARQRSVEVSWHRTRPPAEAPPVRVDASGAAYAPSEETFESAAGEWQIDLPAGALRGSPEVYLTIDYVGDIARAYVGNRLVDDDFYFDRPWEIGLSRIAPDVLSRGLTVRILPLRRDAPIYLPKDRWPASFFSGQAAAIRGVFAEPEYEVLVKAPPK